MTAPLVNGADARPILITGGAGFIGSNIADRLAGEGHAVLVYDALSRPGVERNLAWLQGPTREPRRQHRRRRSRRGRARARRRRRQRRHSTSPRRSPSPPAWSTRATTSRPTSAARSTFSTRFACAASGCRVIFASTNKVYGDLGDVTFTSGEERHEPIGPLADTGIDESRPLDFHTPYGCSKGAADQYVLDYCRSFGIPTAVFRMSCIYGQRQMGTEDQGWVAHFLIRALEGQPITIYGDGRQVRDILDVEDAVDAYIRAWQRIDRVQGRAHNLGGGPANAISLLQLLDEIRAITGRDVDVRFEGWRPGDQRWYVSEHRCRPAGARACRTARLARGRRPACALAGRGARPRTAAPTSNSQASPDDGATQASRSRDDRRRRRRLGLQPRACPCAWRRSGSRCCSPSWVRRRTRRSDREAAGIRLIDTGLPLDWGETSRFGACATPGRRSRPSHREKRVDLVQTCSAAVLAEADFEQPTVAVQHSCVASWWAAVRGTPLPAEFQWRDDLVRAGLRRADAVVAPSAAFAAETARFVRSWHGDRSSQWLQSGSGGPDRRSGTVVLTASRLWDEGKDVATLDAAAAQIEVPLHAAGALYGPERRQHLAGASQLAWAHVTRTPRRATRRTSGVRFCGAVRAVRPVGARSGAGGLRAGAVRHRHAPRAVGRRSALCAGARRRRVRSRHSSAARRSMRCAPKPARERDGGPLVTLRRRWLPRWPRSTSRYLPRPQNPFVRCSLQVRHENRLFHALAAVLLEPRQRAFPARRAERADRPRP